MTSACQNPNILKYINKAKDHSEKVFAKHISQLQNLTLTCNMQ